MAELPKSIKYKKKKTKIINFPEVWMEQLKRNEDGEIKNTIDNYCIILENHKEFAKKLKLNELSNNEEFNKNAIEQVVYDNILRVIEKEYGIYSDKKMLSALRTIAYRYKYHPIKEYLEGLKWDGIKRADTAFADYFGAEESKFNAMCIRLMLFGAIERLYNPGCKYDSMVILKGAQGLGKSTFFRMMCNDDGNFYLDDFKDFSNSFDQTNGKWIIEVGELSAMGKAEKNRVKSFITSRGEQHRVPYDRTSKFYPRQFIVFGTTNEECFLDDPTGERRFPVVECAEAKDIGRKKIKKRMLWDNDDEYNKIKEDIQQILAEVFEEYKAGKKFLRVPKEFEEEFIKIQSRYYYEDTDVGFIEEFLEGKKETCFEQIWREALGHTNPKDKPTKSDKTRITNLLANMKNWKLYDGNEQHKKRISGYKVGYNGMKEEMSYGVQKAWIWYDSEEEDKEEKDKQKITDNINRIMGENYKIEDLWEEV